MLPTRSGRCLSFPDLLFLCWEGLLPTCLISDTAVLDQKEPHRGQARAWAAGMERPLGNPWILQCGQPRVRRPVPSGASLQLRWAWVLGELPSPGPTVKAAHPLACLQGKPRGRGWAGSL